MGVETGHEGRAAARAERRPVDEDTGYGWVMFAGVLLLVAGTLNTIYGIAAIDKANVFVNDAQYVFADLDTYGWVLLCLGIAQVLVGLGVLAKNQLSRWVGVLVLSLAAIAQMLFIPAYPLLSLAILTMQLFAVYGLIAYGGRLERTV
jgi:hypothetical protein